MYSTAVERALEVSLAAHAGQRRKGAAGTPYIVHPLHVAFMLARLGMDDVAIQAALLHDVVEDCEEWTVARLVDEFGPHVAKVVAQLTEDKTRSWAERKQDALAKVVHLCERARAVKAADKLHNLQSLVAELRAAPDAAVVWTRFNGGRDGTLRVARELVDQLAPRVDERLASALRETLAELERLA